MPNHSPVAIANEFLRRRASSGWPAQMQLQKLVYIAHGWNLAINGEPLVNSLPEAWDNGPVFREIWDHIRDFGYRGQHCALTDPFDNREISEELSSQEKAVIDHVWNKYRGFSGLALSKMTHEPGTPWYRAYFGGGQNTPLSNEHIKHHYVELALAGRGAK
ncbi:Panacea domain-containing protein [Bradyrhizobium sp. UFLA05-109]